STAPGVRRGPSGVGSSHPAPRTGDPMSSPQQRVHEATRRLLDLLEHGESLSPEAIELRFELAVATAEAGHLDDSYYQVEELLEVARREHGPDHPSTARAREAAESVRALGMRAAEALALRSPGEPLLPQPLPVRLL